MSLFKFPNELFYIIAEDLSTTDINSLFQTNRHLNAILAPLLHKVMVQRKNKLLFWAARKGRETMIKLLLENGTDIDFWEDNAALYIAVEEGHEDTVKFLLNNGAQIYNRQGPSHSQRSALHVASESGRESIARLLIEKGADIDAPGAGGMTPIHFAILYRHVDIINLLIEKGCNVNPKYDTPDLMTPLQQAADQANVEAINILLNAGASVFHRGVTGSTPFHMAVKGGTKAKAAARLLLERGSDINAADREGMTPLFLAVESCCISMVKWLLSKGASTATAGEYQRTALHNAVISQPPLNVSMVEILMGNGIDIDAQDHNGNTALHLAINRSDYSNRNQMIKLLLERGANPNIQDKNNGRTVLHWAALRRIGYELWESLFAGSGMDLSIRDNDGRTASDLYIK